MSDRERWRSAIEFLGAADFTDEVDDPEHALHEICHAVTLGCQQPFNAQLDRAVTRRINTLGWLSADWNEILTCAAELRAAKLIEMHLHPATVLAGNVNCLSPGVALALVERLIWTESSYRRARQALDAACITAEAMGWRHG